LDTPEKRVRVAVTARSEREAEHFSTLIDGNSADPKSVNIRIPKSDDLHGMRNLYVSSDLFVSTITRAPWSFPIFQALACRIPVAMSKEGVFWDILHYGSEEGLNGIGLETHEFDFQKSGNGGSYGRTVDTAQAVKTLAPYITDPSLLVKHIIASQDLTNHIQEMDRSQTLLERVFNR
jgi:hypothetical protein